MTAQTGALAGETQLGSGTWRVAAAPSSLSFAVKTAWGMQMVRGTFGRFDGTLKVAADGSATGELTAAAATLDTGHAKRDEHLRTDDFFGVERHPDVRFTVHSVTSRTGGMTIAGDLRIKDGVVRLHLPVDVVVSEPGQLRLKASTSVARDKIGMSWNRMGMIRGDAQLHVDVTLVR